MLDAIARAARLPVADVRRAAMYAGGLATVAQAALTEGAAGLARFSIRLLQPVQPMLATPADDVAAALAAARHAPRSSGSSTARGCRSTRPATKCGSSRAT